MHKNSHIHKIKKNLILFLLFFLASLYPILYYGSENIVLAINSFHNPILDSIATKITLFGSLWFYILFLGALTLSKRTIKEVGFAGISFFNTCIIVEILKHIIFKTVPRPIDTINTESLHIVENFSHDHYSSFPSGHASTIFVVISVLSIFLIKKSIYIQVLFLLVASLVAISRVYLSMHFYHDVYAGAFIGYACTRLTYYGISKIKWPIWVNKNFYQVLGK
jgi:membrane-associated phospholipid phosphatase